MERTDESLDFRILLIDENLHMQYVVKNLIIKRNRRREDNYSNEGEEGERGRDL